MSKQHVDDFRTNIERYFDGPDPRNRGRAGIAVGGLDHKQYRKFGDFSFYRYREEDKSKGRLGGSPDGNFLGVGLKLNRNDSLVLLARPDVEDVLFRWNHFMIGEVFEGIGFENQLDDKQAEKAVELTTNPLIFTEFEIFSGLTHQQATELNDERKRYEISSEQLRRDLEAIDDAHREAWKSGRDTIIG